MACIFALAVIARDTAPFAGSIRVYDECDVVGLDKHIKLMRYCIEYENIISRLLSLLYYRDVVNIRTPQALENL